MTFLTIIFVIIIGLLMLWIAKATKKRWLKFLSIIPFAIAVWQLASLFLMGL
ncbi:hypothetical protein [Bacillus sp. FJAT-18017]|uniref:hypothetical protein n=1 Tax=Bacillus sp. FJAT-18017 TaxID=1705566 RepID=UPI000A7AF723|nr:hypothetical protein [Bacillus sp. FJAT-18017]